MNETTTKSVAQRVLADQSASQWLKQVLQSALQRDPVDAFNDALTLAEILEERMRDALGINP